MCPSMSSGSPYSKGTPPRPRRTQHDFLEALSGQFTTGTTTALSSRYCDLLGLKERGRSVAWDLYLIYDKGTRWSAGPPMPKVWMQQLLLDDVPELEQTALVSQLRQRLEKTDP